MISFYKDRFFFNPYKDSHGKEWIRMLDRRKKYATSITKERQNILTITTKYTKVCNVRDFKLGKKGNLLVTIM